ncbi:cysteine desulfurase-like isoform X2 [Rhopilema esculentum]|uniref:cysteine desulfurase-like isoform X2 n=1 Tax=Rhopilema esculentum TaxID=499914 RepID=UPI0031D9923C
MLTRNLRSTVCQNGRLIKDLLKRKSALFNRNATVAQNVTDSRDAKSNDEELKPIYLDAQATTPLDPRVLDAMLPYHISFYGNPHSRTHAYGWETEKAVEDARKKVADLIGADPKEVIFTSGATESNNIAVKGIARFNKRKKRHVITTQTEHKCVLDSCRVLEAEGFEVTYLPVQKNGIIDIEELKSSIRPDTSLVSIMTVNNEIGVKQPVHEIGAICRENKVHFHTDAAQAVGKIPIDVNEMKIDLMSISGHKIYGPKGIGALYVRRRPRVRLEPQMNGGGQERGFRSGTVPAPLVVGLGAACELSLQEMEYDYNHVKELSDRLIAGIESQLTHVIRNGDPDLSYPGCINLSFAYVEGESLLMALKEIALSSGSACTSASLEPSYVLRAIGAEEDLAHSSLRFGIGRFTTQAEVDFTVKKCVESTLKLREMSPLWEMVQDGIDLKNIQWSQH